MFGSRHNLSRPDFAKVNDDRTAKRLSSEHFSIVMSRAAAVQGCAVVVSKKVAKGAVQRHLLKRRVREVIRPWCAEHQAGVIVYARAGSAPLPYSQIASELQKLLQQFVP